MPGFMTHCIFSEQVAKTIQNPTLSELLMQHKEAYMLGSQGPDIFFYNPICHLYKDHRNTGVYMHANKTNDFFKSCFEALEKQKPADQAVSLAYLSGFLCHYYLDQIAHPYINWYTFKLKGSSNGNTFDIHSAIETNIDGVYLKKYKNKKPSELSHQEYIAVTKPELKTISCYLSDCLKKTYLTSDDRNTVCFHPHFISFSVRSMQTSQSLLIDRTGIKKRLVRFVEKHALPSPLLTGLIIIDKQEKFGDYLNLSHENWTNPWEESLHSSDSFPELFHKAVKTCSEILSQLTPGENDPAALSALLKKIGNRSYHSGLLLA